MSTPERLASSSRLPRVIGSRVTAGARRARDLEAAQAEAIISGGEMMFVLGHLQEPVPAHSMASPLETRGGDLSDGPARDRG